jgi:hypothetical protein
MSIFSICQINAQKAENFLVAERATAIAKDETRLPTTVDLELQYGAWQSLL